MFKSEQARIGKRILTQALGVQSNYKTPEGKYINEIRSFWF